MPGVPSGRGCEACRKQKKKCDQQKPSCARCSRLNVTCIGGGEQRYKFKNQSAAVPARHSPKHRAGCQVFEPSKAPSNDLVLVTNVFIWTLGVQDIRYGLGVYGEFLRDIPRRLGTNEALDTAVGALTSAYPMLYTRQPSVEALSKYVQAIRALRICVEDPVQARCPNTLCAIYLMMICQEWVGKKNDHHASHGEAMAYILGAGTYEEQRDNFQGEMLLTLCAPIIFESIINPKIQLPQWLHALPEPCGPDPMSAVVSSLSLHKLARIPAFVHDPEAHYIEIFSAHDRMRQELAKLHDLIAGSTELVSPGILITTSNLHVRYRMAYGLILCLAVILNAILRAFDQTNAHLILESTAYINEILSQADDMCRYRPLGAGYILICLMAAWAVTDNDLVRETIEVKMAIQYDMFVAGSVCGGGQLYLRDRLERLRLKHAPRRLEQSAMECSGHLVRCVDEMPADAVGQSDACCVQ